MPRAVKENTRRLTSRSHPIGAGFAVLCILSASALAQSPPATQTPGQAPVAQSATKPAATPPVVTEIVATGERSAAETRIDRRIDVVSHDLQADIGTAADVLQNLPSISVDLDGSPSLRGDPDVQILIDGHPAPQFSREAIPAVVRNDRCEVGMRPGLSQQQQRSRPPFLMKGG